MKPNTVLMLSHCFAPNIGGVETHLSDLTEFLRKKNISCLVLTYQPLVTRARAPFIERNGSLTVFRIPWIGFGLFNRFEPYPLIQFLYLFPPLFITAFFLTLFHKTRIPVIHAHGMVCAVIARLLKIFFRTRTLISIHAVYGWLYSMNSRSLLGRFLRWTLSGNDQILSLASKSRDEIIALGIPPGKTGTFTYWVDQNLFRPGNKIESRERIGIRNILTALFVGRLIPAKGIDVLLQTALNLPEIQFVFVGDGPMSTLLTGKSREMRNIVFAGNIANHNLPDYYNAADLLCVPSQYEEGFGRIILEALSCGCPVIAANKGGIPEAMDNSVGKLITPTSGEFQATISEFTQHPDLLANIRAHCRPFAEERFGISNAEAILRSYDLPEKS